MKKGQTVQGTFSKIFGKKHASPTASLYVTNPPWIFTREAAEEGARDLDGIYYGDNRFDTVSESGTATLKARPRVRPLLTFLPLNAQENHGLAVPTPSVPEDFADKEVTGASSLANGNLRLYSSVGDLRPVHYGEDPPIPPPPPGPAPRPPPGPAPDTSPPPGQSLPTPPPPLPPALLVEPPPPPSMAPPPPPVSGALSPPTTPTPPDFIPPAPPLAFVAPPPPPMPAPAPPAPVSPHTPRTHLSPPAGVTKWKSEVTLNGKQPEAPGTSPPRSPAEPKGSPLGPKPESHLTFPRSFKVPPPTPVRTSSIPVQEAHGAPAEGAGAAPKAPSRMPLPPSFHIRPASQVYPDRAPEPDRPGELRAKAPASPGPSQTQARTSGHAETPPPASPLPRPTPQLPPPAPPLPPPAPPLPPPAPPLPSAEKATPPPARFMQSPKPSSPAPKPKPNPPSPEDTAPSEPVDWRDPAQMAKLRSELAAYLFGSKREDRGPAHRPGPTAAPPAKEGRKGPGLPEKEGPPGDPEKSPCPEREAPASLPLPPADYTPGDSPALSVQQIRSELEARLSASAEREPQPGAGSLPPKPRPEAGRVFEHRAAHGQISKPTAKNGPPLPAAAPPAAPHQPTAAPGPATPPKATPDAATSGPATPATATALPATPFPVTERKPVPAEQRKKPEPHGCAAPSQPEAGEGRPSEARKPPSQGALSPPALPPKLSPGRGEVTCLYKPHRGHSGSQSSPSREVAVVMPTVARGGAVEVGEPRGLPGKAPAPAPPAEEPLRHPVTGELVEKGSPMALLLAARQRAQKGRARGAGPGRTSLPGSLRGQPQAGSDSIFLRGPQPNSFTVVPRPPSEPEREPQPRPWRAQPGRGLEDTEPGRGHGWTKAEPQAWDRSASSRLPQGRPPPRSFSSPSSPSRQREEEGEFSFEVIPPPPEFSNDPEPQPRALPNPGRRASPPRSRFPDSGRPLDARFPAAAAAGEPSPGAGGLQRFSGSGRSLIKKRLYVGEPPRGPAPSRGGSGRNLSSPNCFGPQPGGHFGAPGGPEMRRVNSAGRAPPGGLRARRMSLEGSARGEAKFKAAGPAAPSAGDLVLAAAAGRSPRYGSPVNTFTVRPGTRHPISYAYSGAHRNALS